MYLRDKTTYKMICFGDKVTTNRGEEWYMSDFDEKLKSGRKILLTPIDGGDSGRGCIKVKPETINAEWWYDDVD